MFGFDLLNQKFSSSFSHFKGRLANRGDRRRKKTHCFGIRKTRDLDFGQISSGPFFHRLETSRAQLISRDKDSAICFLSQLWTSLFDFVLVKPSVFAMFNERRDVGKSIGFQARFIAFQPLSGDGELFGSCKMGDRSLSFVYKILYGIKASLAIICNYFMTRCQIGDAIKEHDWKALSNQML